MRGQVFEQFDDTRGYLIKGFDPFFLFPGMFRRQKFNNSVNQNSMTIDDDSITMVVEIWQNKALR